MKKLKTIQNLWETTTKAFDNMNEEEKKEWFKSLIEKLDENESIQWLKDKRSEMTETQKLKLYKMNAVTIGGFLKRGSPIYQISSSIINGVKNTKKEWWKNAIKFAVLEQIPCRFFVELWILEKPEWLTEKDLINDVQKDAKNFNKYLSICKTICSCIPEARAAVPFIWMAKQYTKRYKDHWTETLISRLNQKKELDIKEQTKQKLAETINNKEILKNSA